MTAPHPTTPEPGYVIEAGAAPRGRLRALWSRRGVLGSFVLRELKIRYAQALLGGLWALAQPLALALALSLIVRAGVNIDTGGAPYGLFAFTALVPWTFFQASVLGAVPSLVHNAGLIRKMWFPREALPLGVVGAVFLDGLLASLLWFFWLTIEGYHVGLALLWWLPLWLILVVTTAGVSLLGAAINALYRDVKHALPIAMQVGLLASPVAYRLASIDGAWRDVFALNPLASVMEGLRRVGLEGQAPDPALTGIGAAGAVLLWVVGWWVFGRVERRFADVL